MKDELENIQAMNASTENIFKRPSGADLEESVNPQEPVEHPQAISFLGALKIPVSGYFQRDLWME